MEFAKKTTFLNVRKSKHLCHRLLAQISTSILKERIARNMSQKDFAKKMNVSQGLVSRWESGECNFTIEAFSEICAKLDLEPQIIIKKAETKNAPNIKLITPIQTNIDFSNIKNGALAC